MPKAKKMGRPKLPKGHAKGKIVPVRFNDSELKHFTRAAKANEQNLSEWVREELRLWDDRLDEHGIDGIVWQGVDQGDPNKKAVWIIFKEIQNNTRFTVSQDVFSNKEQNHYATPVIDEELTKRGIENVWVTTTRTPFIRSRIHLQIAGLREPITILKRY